MKKVGIIILNYNNWEDTIQCIESVLDIKYENYNLYIVDNLSPNDSFQKLSAYVNKLSESDKVGLHNGNNDFITKIDLIQSDRNGGYAAGNNFGINQALKDDCDYILILNNDSLVTNDFLNVLVDFLESHNDVFLCGPKIIDTDSGTEYGARRFYNGTDYFFVPPSIISYFWKKNPRWKHIQFAEKKPFSAPFPIDVPSGSCMLFKKEYFQTGLLDENTFLYFEELIIGQVAKRQGYLTYCVPDAVIYHAGGKSTATTKKTSPTKHFINACRYYMREYQGYSFFKSEVLLVGFYIFLFFQAIKIFFMKR